MSEFFSPEFISELSGFISRHIMFCGAWLVVLVLLIIVQFKIMTARVKKASTGLAVMMVNRENGVFVDLRAPDRFKLGHIANSINMTAAEIKAGKINRIEKNREKPVILVGRDKYDSDSFNCARSLQKEGFTQVFILEGGIAEWENSNMPLTTKN